MGACVSYGWDIWSIFDNIETPGKFTQTPLGHGSQRLLKFSLVERECHGPPLQVYVGVVLDSSHQHRFQRTRNLHGISHDKYG